MIDSADIFLSTTSNKVLARRMWKTTNRKGVVGLHTGAMWCNSVFAEVCDRISDQQMLQMNHLSYSTYKNTNETYAPT